MKGESPVFEFPFQTDNLASIKARLNLSSVQDVCFNIFISTCFLGFLGIGNVTSYPPCCERKIIIIKGDLRSIKLGSSLTVRAS